MHMMFIGRDKPGQLGVRTANREAHLAYLATHGAEIKVAGPYLDEATGEPRGSLLILDVASLDAANALLAEDPYARAGLFETTEIRPWRWVIGVPKS
ncbi:MAG: YciI family protein [Ancalomicrobiaceae bacterium]|nr:YciI family protein [Ancalomicrobiaceae bacterium]